MWERTLQDLIRGLRANKKDEAKFISQAVDEIRQEIKSKDMELKAGAVMKLTYVRVHLFHLFVLLTHAPLLIARYAWLRYELGFLSRCRGHVISQVSPQECWLFGCGPVISSGYRRSHVNDKFVEEGEYIEFSLELSTITSFRI